MEIGLTRVIDEDADNLPRVVSNACEDTGDHMGDQCIDCFVDRLVLH